MGRSCRKNNKPGAFLMDYLLFSMAGEEFGIPIGEVREVVKAGPIHPLPQAPAFIEGVTTLRKHTLAVMDLRKRFNLPSENGEDSSHLLVVRLGQIVLGLLVDRANEVLGIADGQIDQALKVTGTLLEGKALKGIAHMGDRMILLLDLAEILNRQEKGELERSKE